ncbi:hypothetical protein VNO77_25877 [Canavalia gladiata]|uniref:Uncharacterized protein n=1 Tax=Canavalia gladiata TaxID=3824 RepID=A0AAN9KTB0_CANGL
MTRHEQVSVAALEAVTQVIPHPWSQWLGKILIQARMRLNLARTPWLIQKDALVSKIVVLLVLPFSEIGKRIAVIQIMIVAMGGEYARSIPTSAVNLVPFNLPQAQLSFVQYDTTYNQLGQMSQTQASLGFGPPSSLIMSPFCTTGLNQASQASRDGAYLQWPSAAMMYAHSYDQFRHAVFQVNYAHSSTQSGNLCCEKTCLLSVKFVSSRGELYIV